MPSKRLSNVQMGFATLTLTVLLLAIIIIITLYTARFKAQEQRITRNYMAMQEAIQVADAGLEQTIQILNEDLTDLTKTINGEVSGAPYTAEVTAVEYPNSPRGAVNIVEVSITADSSDGSASHSVQQQLVVMSLLRGGPTVPLAIRGASTASGSFEIVANPNGGGDGVPLSVWSRDAIGGSGNFTSCGQHEYLIHGDCTTDSLSESGDMGIDIYDNDPNFPDDLLDYLFGVPEEQWETLRNQADQIVEDCSSLDASTTGFIWVTGGCQISSNTVVGSPDDPVIIIVHNGDLTMNGGAEVYGMVFHFSPSDDPTYGTWDIALNGTNSVFGALIMNQSVDLSTGNFLIRYDGDITSRLTSGETFLRLYRVGGSWNDFR